MSWTKKLFGGRNTGTASLAKERLLVAVAYQRAGQSNKPDYLPLLQADILAAVRKYIQVPENAVQCQIDNDGGLEILEVSVTLNDHESVPIKANRA